MAYNAQSAATGPTSGRRSSANLSPPGGYQSGGNMQPGFNSGYQSGGNMQPGFTPGYQSGGNMQPGFNSGYQSGGIPGGIQQFGFDSGNQSGGIPGGIQQPNFNSMQQYLQRPRRPQYRQGGNRGQADPGQMEAMQRMMATQQGGGRSSANLNPPSGGGGRPTLRQLYEQNLPGSYAAAGVGRSTPYGPGHPVWEQRNNPAPAPVSNNPKFKASAMHQPGASNSIKKPLPGQG